MLDVTRGVGGGDRHRREAFSREVGSPVVAQQLGEPGQGVLLDQEVRLGPSALAGAGRTTDEDGNAGGEAAIAERLHLGDRAGDRRDDRYAFEELLRNIDRKRLHRENLRQSLCGSKPETGDDEAEVPVKLFRLGMLICGALGIVGLLTIGIELMEVQQTNTILLLIAFGLPIVMAAIAFVRPPMQPWQAGVALAGFALAAWKLQVWTLLRLGGDQPLSQWLIVIGTVLGVITSITAIMKPEERA